MNVAIVQAEISPLAERIGKLLIQAAEPHDFEPGKKAHEAAQEIYGHAAISAAHSRHESENKLASDVLLALLLAGEESYVKVSQIIAEPLDVDLEPESLVVQGRDFAESRQPFLENFAKSLAAEIKASRKASKAAGLSDSDTMRALRDVVKKTSKLMIETEATATCGICQQRILQKAGFKTVIWSQLDRPGKRETHELNEQIGEVPIGYKWPNGQQYPGDPEGGPGECVNCECQLIGGSRTGQSLRATDHNNNPDGHNQWTDRANITDKSERALKIGRINELKEQGRPLSEKGNLTRPEAERFRSINKELNAHRFDLSRPLQIEKIGSNEERQSTIPAHIVKIAHADLMRSKKIYDPIVDAAVGVSFSSYTPVDDIMSGKNPEVSAKELYEGFSGTREAMRSHYGDSIELHRAVGSQIKKPTTNWATTREYARQFGGNVITKRLPIDDIIAVNVGAGKYHELIIGQKP